MSSTLSGVSNSSNWGYLSPTNITALITTAVQSKNDQVTNIKSSISDLTVLKAIFSDMKTKMSALDTVAEDLAGLNDYTFGAAKNTYVSNSSALSVSASDSAVDGNYNMSVTQLAKAHSIHGKKYTSSSEALGLSGKFSLNGKEIQVAAEDTLNAIRDKINAVTYDSGKGVRASIIDNQLVLTATSTGKDGAIVGADLEGGSILQQLELFQANGTVWSGHEDQEALDATFTVNGMSVTRSSNTGIEDVISGLTINLNGTGSSTVSVSTNQTSAKNKVTDFITKLNDVMNYIKAKTSTVVTASTTGGNPTYTRGVLAGDSSFIGARQSLYQAAIKKYTHGTLADLGITINSTTGQFEVSDSAKLTDALANNMSNTGALLKEVSTEINKVIDPFVENSENILTRRISDTEDSIASKNDRITSLNESITKEKERLQTQYEALQQQLINAYNSQSEWSYFSGLYTNTSS